jgi:hypothetical protein
MGIGHLSVGLAAKALAPKAHLGVLLVASEGIDILWGIFALIGFDRSKYSPWSHGLFMALFWSLLAALLAWRIYKDRRTAGVIGLVFFSHWVLDFISHPMGVLGFGNLPDLPLFMNCSPKVGLGLYTILSMSQVVTIEVSLILVGLLIYLHARGALAQIGAAFKRGLH